MKWMSYKLVKFWDKLDPVEKAVCVSSVAMVAAIVIMVIGMLILIDLTN